MLGGQHGRGAVWVSDDGRTWRPVTIDGLAGQVKAVAGGGPGWILLEESGQGWVSRDGLAWQRLPEGWPGVNALLDPPIAIGTNAIVVSSGWRQPGSVSWVGGAIVGGRLLPAG